MSINLRRPSASKCLISAFVFFATSFTLFQAAFRLGESRIQIVGFGYIGPPELAIAGAALCVLGSVCLGAGSVLLDKRMRVRKAAAVVPQVRA